MNTRHLLQFSLVLLFALAGCGGEMVEYQSRPSPGKAVENPWSIASANDEVFSRDSGAMQLATVDIPDQKDKPPQFHSVLDVFATPASRPATLPALQPLPSNVGVTTLTPGAVAVAPGDVLVKVVAKKNPDDQWLLSLDHEANVTLQITSPGGSGSLTLERTADTWPAEIHVTLQNAAGKPLPSLDQLSAAELTPNPDGPPHKLPLKTTLDKSAGTGQITIPGFSRSQQIQIDWSSTAP